MRGAKQSGKQTLSRQGEGDLYRDGWGVSGYIIRALSEVVGGKLPYDNLGALRRRIAAELPHATAVDDVVPAEWAAFGQAGALGDAPFASTVTRHYLTNPICRASTIMAECHAVIEPAQEGTGTHG